MAVGQKITLRILAINRSNKSPTVKVLKSKMSGLDQGFNQNKNTILSQAHN